MVLKGGHIIGYNERRRTNGKKEVVIYEICDILACYYGLKEVPQEQKQKIIEFLKQNGAHWEQYVSRIDRETKAHYYYCAPPKSIKKIDFSKLDVKVKVIQIYSWLLFLEYCDSEILDDEDHFFS